MIELARLRAVEEIIVHDNCPDGIASAMVLHDALPQAKIVFCQYNTELHKTIPAKRGQLFADFSPHPSRTQEFLDVEALVLDHHGGPPATVTKTFAERGLGAFADEKLDPGVCGAVLAFREVWMPMVWETPWDENAVGIMGKRAGAIRDFATLAGIRDTWQKNDPRWREACEQAEALRFWPWDVIAETPWDRWPDLMKLGAVLFDRNLKKVERSIGGAHKFVSGKGRRVTAFEGLKPSSDAAEMMGDSNDLTIGLAFFVEDGQAKMIFSTRGRGDFHCQNLALAHGGGGHRQAAGFSIPLRPGVPHPFELVERVVARYESVEDEWTQITAEPTFAERVKNGEIVPKNEFDNLLTRKMAEDAYVATGLSL